MVEVVVLRNAGCGFETMSQMDGCWCCCRGGESTVVVVALAEVLVPAVDAVAVDVVAEGIVEVADVVVEASEVGWVTLELNRSGAEQAISVWRETERSA